MKLTAERKLILGSTITLAVLVINSFVWYRAVRRLIDNDRRVAHTREVLLQLEMVLSTMKDAETGQRGYVITGEEPYLQPYETAVRQIKTDVETVKELTADDPEQQAQIPAIEAKIAAKLEELNRVIALRKSGNVEGARQEVRSGIGKQRMDELREIIAGMESKETSLLDQRAEESQARRRDVVLTLLVASLVACALLVLVCLIVVRDIAARKRSEELLNQQREWLHVTLASIGDGVIATDRAGSVTFMNAVAESLTGWMKTEAEGQPLEKVFNIVNEEARTRVDNPALRAIEEGLIVGLANHTVLVAKNGSETPIDDSGAPIKDSGGATIGAVLIFRDITARRKADQVQALLAGIVESSEDAIISKDLDGYITSWNTGAQRIFGYSAEEAVGQPITIMVPTDRLQEEATFVEHIRQDRKIEQRETVRLAKNGACVDVSLTISPVRDALGRITGASKIARDITERRHAEELLRQQHEWLRVTLASIGDAVIATDTNGYVTFMNGVAEHLTGWDMKEAEGRPVEQVFNVVNERTRLQVSNPALRAIREGIIVGLANHTILISRDGGEISIDDSGAPIRDSRGDTIGAVLVFRDITQRRQDEKERSELFVREQAAREVAEAASRAKDEFVATISHEIRTPLNAILGWAQMLRTGKFDPTETGHAIEAIERNARTQAQLIEDLLDLSRVITGKLKLQVGIVELKPVIEAALESIRPAADAKSIVLKTELRPDASVVSGDPNRLQQVVWNLLLNAVKFTPRGGLVSVKVQDVDSQLQIVVSDTGVGIKEDFLPYVFDRFSQADASTTRRSGGLGLGLAITKHLVELHGGSVRAWSKGEGQGTTFTVSLPACPAADRALKTSAISAEAYESIVTSPTALEKLKIMVVDDDADTRDLLTVMLTARGADTRAYPSAGTALLELSAWQPSIIVSDVQMPEQDGYSFIQAVRELGPQQGGKTPAIALTAYATAEDRKRALAAGFNTHVPKPVDPGELIMVIARLADQGGQTMHA